MISMGTPSSCKWSVWSRVRIKARRLPGRRVPSMRPRSSERKFREVVKYFAHDLQVLTMAKLCGLNYRTVHRLCELLRQEDLVIL